jgi:hypothetical protein
MPPPPENQLYDTAEIGIASINTFARDYGYAVSTRNSKHTKTGVRKTVRLCCDRGRAYRPRQEASSRIRKTTTLAIECPFIVSLRLQQDTTNTWLLTHENTQHNHGPSPPSTHQAHRGQEITQKASNIDHSIRQGYTTRQILTSLREEDPRSALIARDIYNRRKKISIEFLAGRTAIQVAVGDRRVLRSSQRGQRDVE